MKELLENIAIAIVYTIAIAITPLGLIIGSLILILTL